MKAVLALVIALALFGAAAAQYEYPQTCSDNWKWGDSCQCENPVASSTGTDVLPPLSISAITVENANLKIEFTEDVRYRYMAADKPDMRMYGADGAAFAGAEQACYDKFTWTVSEPAFTTCEDPRTRTWTGTALLSDIIAISGDSAAGSPCPFELDVSDPAKMVMKFNFHVVNTEAVAFTGNDGLVGEWTHNTIEHAMPFFINWDRTVDVKIENVQALSIIDFGRAVVATAIARTNPNDVDTELTGSMLALLTVRLRMVMVNPYYIFNVDTKTVTVDANPDEEGRREILGWKLTEGQTDCDASDLGENFSGDCDRTYDFQVVQQSPLCNFANTYTATFKVDCLGENTCGYVEGDATNDYPTVEVTFTIGQSDWCPELADTVEIQSAMGTWGTAPPTDSSFTSNTVYTTLSGDDAKTNFLHGQEMYFVVTTSNNKAPMLSQRFQKADIISGARDAQGNAVTIPLIDNYVAQSGVSKGETEYPAGQGVYGSTAIVSYFMFVANSRTTTTASPIVLNVESAKSARLEVRAVVDVQYDLAFDTSSQNSNLPAGIDFRRQSLRLKGSLHDMAVRSQTSTATAVAGVSGDGNTSYESNDPTFVANSAAVSGAFALVAVFALAVAIVATMKRKAIEKRLGDELARSSSNNNMMLEDMSSTKSDESA